MPTYGTIVPCEGHNCAFQEAIVRQWEVICPTWLSQMGNGVNKFTHLSLGSEVIEVELLVQP